uniref:Uncharacterized protein n=1 Tax=Craspedostauros australis TaxID=1486917 RepID=A0A7R9WWQ0_9STRA|mmetsp:Transcript_24259/g.67601  ORF Transcript_24259/g.67601 Transcript_24259/m.67601 type:complete len:203 (+) Transcript_24259:1-609(+)
MSAQQYEELKKNEDDKMQKMNFGAWGPRFQPTDAPRGDWMVTPRLWTNGFHSDRSPASSPSSGAGASSSTSSSPSTKRTRIAEIIRDQGPGFALAYLLTAFLGSTHGLYRVAQQGWTLRAALLTVLRSAVFIPARISTWRTACAIICMRVAAATGLTQVGCRIIEQANRQRLWAPRRTIAVSAVTMFTSLLVWAGMLHLGMS